MAQHIKKLLNSLVCPRNNWKLKLLYNWQDIIGKLHEKVVIEKIYEDTIVLGVFDSCWLQELYMLSPLLLKTINEKLDQPRIKQVRFRQTGLKQKKKQNKVPRTQYAQKQIHLTSTEQRVLEHINDPTLRRALQAFRIRCYREQE